MARTLSLVLTLLLVGQNEIRVDVQLQQLVATVRDQKGNLVKNLGREDFTLEEDGVPQNIVYVLADNDTPVSLGILIDTSGSMKAGGTLTRLRSAVGATLVLLRLMKPEDEFSLMKFSDDMHVEQAFTTDTAKIEKELRQLKPAGGTNLQDAMENALMHMRKAAHRKKALVIITDGFADLDFARVRKVVQDAEVVVYTFAIHEDAFVGTGGLLSGETPSAVLNVMASESGGRSKMFRMTDTNVVDQIIGFVEDIAAELRGQYVLGYYPSKTPSPGGHVIRIRTKSPDYKVRYQRQDLSVGPGR